MFSSTLRNRLLAGGIWAGLIWTAAVAPAMAQQQPTAAPPDFSSNQTGWMSVGNEFIQPPGPGPVLVTSDPAHPFIPNGTGGQPNYRIADLSNPNLKPWVKERMKKDNDEVLAGKIGYTPRSSCKPAGVPGFMSYGRFTPVYFVQSPKEVVIIFESNQETRRVFMDVPHSETPKSSWYGEGDTLVIDTVGMNDKTVVDAFRTPHTEKLHVVERWRMIDGGKTMEVSFTVDDPDTFNEPWTAIQHYQRVQQPLREDVCAENNLQFDYHMPAADHPDF
jgi:hypothetical protein